MIKKRVRIVNAHYNIHLVDIEEKFKIDGYDIYISTNNTLEDFRKGLTKTIAMHLLDKNHCELDVYSLSAWITVEWKKIELRSDIIYDAVKDFFLMRECEVC